MLLNSWPFYSTATYSSNSPTIFILRSLFPPRSTTKNQNHAACHGFILLHKSLVCYFGICFTFDVTFIYAAGGGGDAVQLWCISHRLIVADLLVFEISPWAVINLFTINFRVSFELLSTLISGARRMKKSTNSWLLSRYGEIIILPVSLLLPRGLLNSEAEKSPRREKMNREKRSA